MFDGLLAGCSLDIAQTRMPFLGATLRLDKHVASLLDPDREC
jgi:hypothetical protein